MLPFSQSFSKEEKMKIGKTFLLALAVLALILAGCAPVNFSPEVEPVQDITPAEPSAPITEEPLTEIETPSRSPQAKPPGGSLSADAPKAVLSAVQSLSNSLNVAADQIEVVRYEERTWRDSCLGLGGPAEMCLQALTPGYLVILRAGGEEYEIHTDATGASVRRQGAPAAGEQPGPDDQAPVIAAVRALQESLDTDVGQIEVVSVEPVEWPDACLGLAQAGEMCAQAITPGYRVLLSAAGQEYEFQTDETGESVRQK
jgi:hypothetical protein